MEVLGSGLFGIPYGGMLDDCIVYPVRVFVKRKYLMGWMCWCHLRQGVPMYGRGIPLRLLFAAYVCYPPVAQTR